MIELGPHGPLRSQGEWFCLNECLDPTAQRPGFNCSEVENNDVSSPLTPGGGQDGEPCFRYSFGRICAHHVLHSKTRVRSQHSPALPVTRDQIAVLGVSCSAHQGLAPTSPGTPSPVAVLLQPCSVTRPGWTPSLPALPWSLPHRRPAERPCQFCVAVLPATLTLKTATSMYFVHSLRVSQGLVGTTPLGSTRSQPG